MQSCHQDLFWTLHTQDLWGENSDSIKITVRKTGQVEQSTFSGWTQMTVRDHCAKLHFRPLLLLKSWEQTALHEKYLYVQVTDRFIWLPSWRGNGMPLFVSERLQLDIHLIMISYLLITFQALQNAMSLLRNRDKHHVCWFILPIIRILWFQLLILKLCVMRKGLFHNDFNNISI